MNEDMTDQAKSPRSRRGSVAPGPASRRPAISTSRVPRKAQEAVDKLIDKIRANADQTPPAAKEEAEREKEKREANGHFAKGTKPGPGRPPGSPNRIPRAVKQVIKALCEGAIEVVFEDPTTKKVVTGPVAHLMAERIVTGLNDPDHYPAFVKMLLEYGIGRPKSQTEVGGEDRRQIPTMIFLNRPVDTLAPQDGKPRPLRILGQIAGPHGEIIDAKTGKIVVPACGQTVPLGDGLGDGEDRLELVEDLPLPCPTCYGGGRQRIGFGDRTEPCDDCAGSRTLQ
jgi:hypothetical protein